MHITKIAVIGFGEAGPVFARGFREAGVPVAAAFDIANTAQTRSEFMDKGEQALTEVCAERAAAVREATLVVSTVTADQTATAAEQVAPFLKPGQVYLDLNSASPQQKKAAAMAIEAAGASFVEGVAMDTIPLKGFEVPLLLAGPRAIEIAGVLTDYGMVAEAVGQEVGAACSIKLIRSVIIKGLEALFAEAMAAGAKLGVEDRIVDTLYETFPGLDWRTVAGYHLSRLAIHGKRRAAEMRESAATLQALGIEPIMATAVAARHQWGVDVGLKDRFTSASDAPSVADFVNALPASGKRDAA